MVETIYGCKWFLTVYRLLAGIGGKIEAGFVGLESAEAEGYVNAK